MDYQRPITRGTGQKEFKVGTHTATIEKVVNKKSKSGNNMFILHLEGKNQETGLFFLTFGNSYTKENLNYLLASIEDNGIEIPKIEFGYNKNTYEFLLKKEVFIEVEEKVFLGKTQNSVKTFLTRDEYEISGEFEEELF